MCMDKLTRLPSKNCNYAHWVPWIAMLSLIFAIILAIDILDVSWILETMTLLAGIVLGIGSIFLGFGTAFKMPILLLLYQWALLIAMILSGFVYVIFGIDDLADEDHDKKVEGALTLSCVCLCLLMFTWFLFIVNTLRMSFKGQSESPLAAPQQSTGLQAQTGPDPNPPLALHERKWRS